MADEASSDIEPEPRPALQPELESRQTRPTRTLDPSELQPWPLATAALERLGPWAHQALKLGTIVLLHNCLDAMTKAQAKADLVEEARVLIDALAHMHWES